MTNTKTITSWLVIDWKSENSRTRKSKPSASELGTNELLAELNVEVEIPDVEVPTLALEIDVPEPQVHAATMEALDEEELPDWTDTAVEVVDERVDDVAEAMDDPDPISVADQLTTQVLIDAQGRPDPEHVRDYLIEVVTNVMEDGELYD